MKIKIANRIFLDDMPMDLSEALKDRLTFDNPKWIENDRMNRWNGNTARYLKCYEEMESGLIIPRGYSRQLIYLCRNHNVSYEINDQRRILPEVEFSFKGQLKAFQYSAVNAMLKRDFGTLSAPTGSGKTVMAIYLIAERRQPVLIVVHTKELLNQWISRIETFLGIPGDEVGIIGGGKKQIADKITVATVQTLYKCAEDVAPYIGHIIVDECHRTPSRTFTEAVTAFDSKYMLGLSATPWRRDKLSRLIYWYLGDVVHEVDSKQLQQNGDILQVEVVTRQTNYSTRLDPSEEYSRMLSELTRDPERNRLIARDVAKESRNGSGVCLVLSDRKTHCQGMKRLLAYDFNTPSEILTGDLSKAQRETIINKLNHGHIKTLVATGQLIGEGFDCKELSTLFLATPIKFDGRVLQYLGRVLRPAPGKNRAVVYDYIDSHVPVLKASAKARQKLY